MPLCRKHPSEAGVGVCAPCLRDRLQGLQSCITPRPCAPPPFQADRSTRPPLFPPPQGKKAPGFSVLSTLFGTPGGGPSPSGELYCRWPDDRSAQRHDQAPAAAGRAAAPSFSSWLAALFAVRCKRNRRPGGKTVVGSHTRGAASSAGSSAGAATSGRENKIDTHSGVAAPCQRPTCRFQRYRGMSPGSEQEEEEEEETESKQQDGEQDRAAAAVVSSPSGSSSASSSAEAHPALPGPTPARAFWRRDAVAMKTGFAVCFSPLVRTRPSHHRRARVVAGDGGGVAHHAGDLQKPGFRLRRQGQNQQHHHRLRHGGGGGGGVKLCPNRSRKLVDMGRFR